MHNKVTEKFEAVLNPRRIDLDSEVYGDLVDAFTSHQMNVEQLGCANAIRQAGLLFAETIALNTPKGADQSAAIRKIREASMTAVASIAMNPKHYESGT